MPVSNTVLSTLSVCFIQGVAIQVTSVPLSDEAYAQLQLLIDPLAECDDYGIRFYQETLRFVEEHTDA